jgi:hypothetical protein
LPIDNDGDGQSDASTSVASPIFHALTLLSDFGPDYWPLPSQQVAGHTISGFASRDAQGVVRVALFSHHGDDIQSRSEQKFQIVLDLESLAPDVSYRAAEYRFDRAHNSYFVQAAALRQKASVVANPEEVKRLTQVLEEGDAAAIRAALAELEKFDATSLAALAPAFLRMLAKATDADLRTAAQAIAQRVFAKTAAAQPGYPPEAIEEIQKLAMLGATGAENAKSDAEGTLRLSVELGGNAASLWTLTPAAE